MAMGGGWLGPGRAPVGGEEEFAAADHARLDAAIEPKCTKLLKPIRGKDVSPGNTCRTLESSNLSFVRQTT